MRVTIYDRFPIRILVALLLLLPVVPVHANTPTTLIAGNALSIEAKNFPEQIINQIVDPRLNPLSSGFPRVTVNVRGFNHVMVLAENYLV